MRRRFVTHPSESESDSNSAACNRACGMMMSKGDRDENAVAKPAGRIWDKNPSSTARWFNRILHKKRGMVHQDITRKEGLSNKVDYQYV